MIIARIWWSCLYDKLKRQITGYCLTGFGVVLLICAIGMIFLNRKTKGIIETRIQTAMEIVKISGILYLLYIATVEIFSFTKYEDSLLHIIHGEYWRGFIIIVLAAPFFIQLFWVEKIRKTPVIRLFIAVSILFAALLVNSDLVEMITNIEREYAEISNKPYYLNLVKTQYFSQYSLVL